MEDGETRNGYKILIGNTSRQEVFGKLRRRLRKLVYCGEIVTGSVINKNNEINKILEFHVYEPVCDSRFVVILINRYEYSINCH